MAEAFIGRMDRAEIFPITFAGIFEFKPAVCIFLSLSRVLPDALACQYTLHEFSWGILRIQPTAIQ